MKKILKIGTVLLLVCLLAFSFNVSAYTNTNVLEFKCPIYNPNNSANTRYIEVVTNYNGTYLYSVIVYEMSNLGGYVTLIPSLSNNQIQIVYYGNEESVFGSRISCYYLSTDGVLHFKASENVYNESHSITHSFTGIVVGVHYYGFDIIDETAFPSNQQEFVISYASEGLQVGYLKSIFNAVSNFNIRDYTSALSSIGTYLDDIESNTYDTYWELVGVHDTLNDLKDILSNPSSSEDIPDYPVKPNPMNPSNPSSPYDPFEYAPPRQDGQEILDSIQDYEDEILGDKTPEEIRDEINDDVDFENKKEEFDGEDIETPSIIEMEGIEGDDNNVVVYNNVFDIVFDCAGGKYRTFLLFNLSIGFAAFVLGRRFG